MDLNAQNLVVEGSPVLLPHLTESERDLLDPAEGMIIYNTDCRSLEGYGMGLIESAVDISDANVSEELMKIDLPFDISLESIALHVNSIVGGSSLKILDGTPCASPTLIDSSSTAGSGGWVTFTFDPPVFLNKETTYYVQTHRGNIVAAYGDLDSRFDNLFYDSGTPECDPLDGTNYAFRISYTGWQKLH